MDSELPFPTQFCNVYKAQQNTLSVPGLLRRLSLRTGERLLPELGKVLDEKEREGMF